MTKLEMTNNVRTEDEVRENPNLQIDGEIEYIKIYFPNYTRIN